MRRLGPTGALFGVRSGLYRAQLKRLLANVRPLRNSFTSTSARRIEDTDTAVPSLDVEIPTQSNTPPNEQFPKAASARILQPTWVTSKTLKPYQSFFKGTHWTPPSWTPEQRPFFPLWDVAPGCIAWLPRRELIPSVALTSDLDRCPSWWFDHPVLILKVEIESLTKGNVLYTPLRYWPLPPTTNSIDEEITERPNEGKVLSLSDDSFMPIENNNTKSLEPYKKVLLLERTEHMSTPIMGNSRYGVFLHSKLHQVDFRALQCFRYLPRPDEIRSKHWDVYRFRLDRRSTNIVAKQHNLKPEPWLKRPYGIWNNFIRRTKLMPDLIKYQV